eukprot:2023633-Rhodomonas_salina.1
MSQTEPLYSCDPNGGQASNRLTLKLRANATMSVPKITLFGLEGAEVESFDIELDVQRDSDACSETWGGRQLAGSDKCFFAFVSQINDGFSIHYLDAMADCQNQMGGGANLVTIRSGAENDIVTQMMLDSPPPRTRIVWIGYSFLADAGWCWKDGQTCQSDCALWGQGECGWWAPQQPTADAACAALSLGLSRQPDGWFALPSSACENLAPAGASGFTICSKHLETTPPLFCKSGTSQQRLGGWSQNRRGELNLEFCQNKSMAANVNYSISFNVNNAKQVQQSPSLSIAVEGMPLFPVSKPVQPNFLKGIQGGADPLFLTSPPGFISTAQGGPCTLCYEGSWCPGGNERNPCPVGSSSKRGSTQITNCTCIPGYYRQNGDCTECPQSSYCLNEGIFSCPDETTSELKSSKLEQCYCKPGMYGGPGMMQCVVCEADHWCPGGTVNNQCPPQTSSPPGSDLKTKCTCIAGYFGPAGFECEECTATFYCPGGAVDRLSCPDPADSPPGSSEPWHCRGRLDVKTIS